MSRQTRFAKRRFDTDVLLLLFHQDLLPFTGRFGDPECAPHTRFPSARETLAVHNRHRNHIPSTTRRPQPRTAEPGHAKAAQRFFITSVLRSGLKPLSVPGWTQNVWPEHRAVLLRFWRALDSALQHGPVAHIADLACLHDPVHTDVLYSRELAFGVAQIRPGTALLEWSDAPTPGREHSAVAVAKGRVLERVPAVSSLLLA